MARGDYDPPGVAGPTVWFVQRDGTPVDIRMVSRDIADAVAAAEALGARYFIRPIGQAMTKNVPVWGVYDRVTAHSWNRPEKAFETETLDAPVMWALAVQAGKDA